jgi:hypothetical protein
MRTHYYSKRTATRVACPFFYPTEGLGQKLWPHPARLPLGGGFRGICRARADEDFLPGEAVLREGCNLGYARPECARFPRDGAPDAVRFAVAGDQEGRIRIQYVVEQEHLPHDHGTLEYDRSARRFLTTPANAILARQAQVYVENYLRRTHDARPKNRKGVAV